MPAVSPGAAGRGRGPRALLAAALAASVLSGCAPGDVIQQISSSGRGAGKTALGGLLGTLTPGLAIPCAGRAGTHGFSQAQARTCLGRLSGDYVRGVERGLPDH